MAQPFDEDDEIADRQGFGSLGGGAAESLDKITTVVKPEGIVSNCPACLKCGRRNAITIEYPEAVVGSLGFIPPNWDMDPRTRLLYPKVGCAACRAWVPLGVSPQELGRYVNTAVSEGYFSGADAQAIRARLAPPQGAPPPQGMNGRR